MEEVAKFFHFLGLMLGGGAGFGSMAVEISLRKVGGEPPMLLRALKPMLGRIGLIGIALLWITGLIMLAEHGTAGLGFLFYIKLACALGILVIATWLTVKGAGYARRGEAPPAGFDNPAKLNGPLALVAMAIAVYLFG